MATVTVRNGVDVRALTETTEAIKAKPGLARFTFRASTSYSRLRTAPGVGLSGLIQTSRHPTEVPSAPDLPLQLSRGRKIEGLLRGPQWIAKIWWRR